MSDNENQNESQSKNNSSSTSSEGDMSKPSGGAGAVSDQSKSSQKSKAAKKKGPIRTEAIVPVLVIGGLLYAYMHFFFDSHIRKGMEWTLTQVHGAEVNIGKLESSFWKAYLFIDNIEVTDKDKPERNLVKVGKIRLQFLWDGLLRAKLVSEQSGVTGIEPWAKRKKPGRVLPKDTKSSKALREAEDLVVGQAKKEFEGNVLGDVAGILGGEKPEDQLKAIAGELASEKKINELKADLDAKKAAWDERLKQLPDSSKIKEYEAKFKALKIDTSDPVKFAKSVKEADKLLKDVDKTVRLVKTTNSELSGDLKAFKSEIEQIKALAENDLKDLKKRLNIPEINTSDLSKKLFLSYFSQQLGSYKKYIDLGKEYIPAPNSKEERAEKKEEQIVPRQRSEGRDVTFKITTSYPTFWFKKVEIGSVLGSTEASGTIQGMLTDLTSHQNVVGKPTVLKLKGEFPKQNIYGFDGNVVVDHRKEPFETFDFRVSRFPVGYQKMSDSGDVRFNINSANGATSVVGRSQNGQAQIASRTIFSDVDYQVEAKSKVLETILNDVASSTKQIDVIAKASGPWANLDFDVKSTLGDNLSKAFKEALQKQIDAAEKQLKDLINGKIGPGESQLLKDLGLAENENFKKLQEVNAKLDKIKQDISKSKKQPLKNPAIEKEKKKVEKKLEKEGKKLLKSLGF